MVGFGQSHAAASGQLLPPGWPGVRTATLRELPGGGPAGPLCLDHHLLTLVTAGHGSHDVDFVAHSCRPGTLIWARPGHVIRYGRHAGLDAILVAWSADLFAALRVTGAGLTDPFGPTHWQLAGEDEDAVINEVSQLVVDCERHRSGDLPAELLRHQLAVLMLRVALLPTAGHPLGAEHATFRRFRLDVERSYAHTRRVEDYAAGLDCSVRTLTRASLAATGRSAKQVIDDRTALQAKRLLACTALPIAEIGQRLGFAEPTNFGRFFHREVGCSPGTFRTRQRRPDTRSPGARASVTAIDPQCRTG
ncbi:MAG TPA: AraC family transcriptional regulator [Pilimelia sp.]|nr:AraC family transcriptional regulator [Pilimelia sp.]